MDIEQVAKERSRLEAQVDLAVRQFMERCQLKEWQVSVSWGPVKVSSTSGGVPFTEVHMASATVRV